MRFPRTDNANACSFFETPEIALAEWEHPAAFPWAAGLDSGAILGHTAFNRGAMLDRKARWKTATKRLLGLILCILSVCILSVHGAGVYAAADSPDKLTPQEAERLNSLRKRLCSSKQLSCDYVDSIFEDARLTIYEPPAPSVSQGPSEPQRQANPYLTARFGLLTTESLERCRSFIQAHTLAFDAAEHI